MDDGYTRIRTGRQPLAEIATCGFAEDDLHILEEGLLRLGLQAKAQRGRLYFDVANTRLLSERIAQFVPPVMRYKLHPAIAERIPFNPDRPRSEPPEVFYDEVEIEDVTLQKRIDKTFFCIDVEDTRNFVTSGGVVHNCRPPGNRNPEPYEVAQCSPHLLRQIALIRPRLILAMGRFAVHTLLQTEATIASLRGRLHSYAGVPLIVTYHPAYLLRNLPDKAKSWADLRFAVKTLDTLRRGARQEKV
jgi:uracil-DNA glycosylase family 4